jgi:DNA-binding NtrC family response regulator
MNAETPLSNPARAIVFVDDELDICDLLEIYASERGYSPLMFHGGNAAIDYLKGHGPAGIAAIVSDVKMPEGDGLELLQYVRANLPDLPVYLTSGQTDYVPEELINQGAAHVFFKPFDIDRLLDVIEKKAAAQL